MDIFEEYAKKMCITCKAEKCDKGICLLQSDYLQVKCVDYKKDETKIERIEPELKVTARRTKNFDRLFQ